MKLERSGRRLSLLRDDATRLDIDLDRGGRYRAIVADTAQAQALADALEAQADVALMPAGGGMLGAMTVAENFALALGWGRKEGGETLAECETALIEALRLCGLSAERVASIGREQPMRLDRVERWLVGFVRHLLRPPELLVFDRNFHGLSRRQAEAVLALEALYHDYHPFRPALFIDVDSHELPQLSACRGELILDEAACLS